MKVKRYNVHTMGNGLLLEFQGDQRITDAIVEAVEKIVGEGLQRDGKPPLEKKETGKRKPYKKQVRISKTKLFDAFNKYGGDLSLTAEELGISVPGLSKRLWWWRKKKIEDRSTTGSTPESNSSNEPD